MKKQKFTKSPLNYVGGKYKLLGQIVPLFPKCDIFVDLFGGGFNVGVNIDSEVVVYNEVCPRVFGIVQGIYEGKDNKKELLNIVEKYNLSKENEEGFKDLRDFYNTSETKDWKYLYMLVCHSFNYQFRFNQKGGYNMPFGRDRSCFSKTLQDKFDEFETKLKNKNVQFLNWDYKDLIYHANVRDTMFFYVDPPYLITTATYTESGGWTEDNERELLQGLDYLDSIGVKFALSNVLRHKGRENSILLEWCKKYTVHNLSFDYKNASYQGKNTNDITEEVLITNYVQG